MRRPAAGRRRRQVVVGLLVLLGVAIALRAHRHPAVCTPHRLPHLTAGDTELWLLSAIVEVPCPSTGRVVYNLKDSRHQSAGVIDPIADPRGGYLAVYHSELKAGPSGRSHFQVSVAHSSDLLHWKWLRTLDPVGASMPTLEPVPGGPGYLLAYEKRLRGVDFIRVRYYAALPALLSGRAAHTVDLPLRLSHLANGTPSFLGLAWNGSARRSVLTLSFHYLTGGGSQGVDREAIGTLRGFRNWRVQPDTRADDGLSALGLTGSHGDLRQFTLGGRTWRVYEAEDHPDGAWHVLLYDVAARRFQPLRLHTASGRYATSFGNPIVRVLPAPGGGGQVLVASVFVFNTGGFHAESGELLYYQPL